jgi:hypothetical protein
MLASRFRNGRSARSVLASVALSAFGVLGFLAANAPSAIAAPSAVTAPSAIAATAHSAVARTPLVAPRATSVFEAFPDSEFGGTPKSYSGCGLHNFSFHPHSYMWFADGQSGDMYNCKNVECGINFVLPSNSNADSPSPVGWESVVIVC